MGICSGTLVNSIGFEWMLVGIAILGFLYAPLLTFLRAPPTREEKKVGDIVTNGTNAIGNGDSAKGHSSEKNGHFNIALTLDNGDLAVPPTAIKETHVHPEQYVTKL